METDKNHTGTVQSVERALKILESFRSNTPELGLVDIADSVGLTKGTVHRLISTLCQCGYIVQDCKAGKYRLGPKVFELGSIAQNHMELYRIAKPFLRELGESTNETVHLVIEADEEVLYVDKVDSLEPIRMNSFIGQRLPMYCSGVGKVLLAYKNKESRAKIYRGKGMEALTPYTVTDAESMEVQVEEIKRNGYAIDMQESQIGLKCVAAPVFDQHGRNIAAISVSGPSYRMTDEKMSATTREVLRIAEKISFAMGYRSR